MIRKTTFLLIILITTGVLLYASSVWEGNASMGRYGEFPNKGFYAASDSFERNTVIEVENLENGKKTTVIVADRLEAGGLFLLLSREAAEAIGITQDELARVRVSIAQPESTDIMVAADDQPYNEDPDINPSAGLEEYEEEVPEEHVADETPDESAQPEVDEAREVDEVDEAREVDEVDEAREVVESAEEGPPGAETTAASPFLEETEAGMTEAPTVEPEGAVDAQTGPEEVPEEAAPAVTEFTEEPVETAGEIEVIAVVPEAPQEPVSEEEEPSEEGAEEAVDAEPPEEEVFLGVSELRESPETEELVLAPKDLPEEPEQPVEGGEISAPPKPEVVGLPESPEEAALALGEVAVTAEPAPPAEEKPEVEGIEASPEEEREEISVAAVDIPEQPETEAVTEETDEAPAEGPETTEIPESPEEEGDVALAEAPAPSPSPAEAETEAEASAEAEAETKEEVPEEEPIEEGKIPEDAEIVLEPAEPKPPEEDQPEAPLEVPEEEIPEEEVPAEKAVKETVPFRTTGRLAAGSYYIQVGAFTEPSSVNYLLKDFSTTYPVTVYKTSDLRTEARYKVLVGPLNQDESGSVLFTVRSKGYGDAFIRKGE